MFKQTLVVCEILSKIGIFKIQVLIRLNSTIKETNTEVTINRGLGVVLESWHLQGEFFCRAASFSSASSNLQFAHGPGLLSLSLNSYASDLTANKQFISYYLIQISERVVLVFGTRPPCPFSLVKLWIHCPMVRVLCRSSRTNKHSPNSQITVFISLEQLLEYIAKIILQYFKKQVLPRLVHSEKNAAYLLLH